MSQEKTYGQLFGSIPLYSEDHLELMLESMDKEQSTYLAIQALVYSYKQGVFSLGESEVVSKIVRTLSKLTESENSGEITPE